MQTEISLSGIYHMANFDAGGTGYFANGGKLIPIIWTCAGEKEPFRFFTVDGQPLDLGVGNSYIAIVTYESPITWEGAQPVETTAETTAG